MDEINALAGKRGLPVIEDAAQSFGATYKGRKSCNLSTIGCTSFFPTKPLGCYGDGGAIFTNDDAIATACREIRVHGQSGRYIHTRIGVGGRMDSIQCAVVLAKLERFEWEIETRQKVAAHYSELLAPLGDRIGLPSVRKDRTSVFAQYTIQVAQRAAIQATLQQAGVPTAVHYPVPMHKQPAYASLGKWPPLPVAEQLAERVMSLPMGADLDASAQRLIVEQMAKALEAARRRVA
jgi:UDP-2-acetamido-2-deoxy-ribo-hexuluronate aminotransferase